MNQKTKKVVLGGLMTAVVFIATYIIKVPAPISGYVNLGDGFIILSGFLLGPFAGIVAALGSALSDFISGPYAVYAPATFIIKGLMGLLAGLVFYNFKKKLFVMTIIVAIFCEAIMVFGYFAFDCFWYGVAGASANVIFNFIQAVAAVIVALILVPVMKKLSPYIGFGK